MIPRHPPYQALHRPPGVRRKNFVALWRPHGPQGCPQAERDDGPLWALSHRPRATPPRPSVLMTSASTVYPTITIDGPAPTPRTGACRDHGNLPDTGATPMILKLCPALCSTGLQDDGRRSCGCGFGSGTHLSLSVGRDHQEARSRWPGAAVAFGLTGAAGTCAPGAFRREPGSDLARCAQRRLLP